MLRSLILSGLLALSGCGGDDEGGTDAESNELSELCTQMCDEVAALMCTAADDSCLPLCLRDIDVCPSEARAWFDCQPMFVCNGDGRPVPANCMPEITAFRACSPH